MVPAQGGDRSPRLTGTPLAEHRFRHVDNSQIEMRTSNKREIHMSLSFDSIRVKLSVFTVLLALVATISTSDAAPQARRDTRPKIQYRVQQVKQIIQRGKAQESAFSQKIADAVKKKINPYVCTAAVAALHAAVIGASLKCAAAIAEEGANPWADYLCASATAGVATATYKVTQVCRKSAWSVMGKALPRKGK
jgi:hypothetical protein